MNRLKRFFVCPLLAVVFVLSGCLFDSSAEERHQVELDEKKEIVTDYMETCLNEKYAEVLGMDPSDDLFEVYDLSKGTNQAWFNRGTYPAKARCLLDEYGEEFSVEIYYLPNEDIVTDEAELRENLYIFGKYSFSSPEELDEVCEFIDKLNELGYDNRIAIKDDYIGNRSMSSHNTTSQEIRDFFEQ